MKLLVVRGYNLRQNRNFVPVAGRLNRWEKCFNYLPAIVCRTVISHNVSPHFPLNRQRQKAEIFSGNCCHSSSGSRWKFLLLIHFFFIFFTWGRSDRPLLYPLHFILYPSEVWVSLLCFHLLCDHNQSSGRWTDRLFDHSGCLFCNFELVPYLWHVQQSYGIPDGCILFLTFLM